MERTIPFDSDTRPAAHPRAVGRFLSRTNWEWRGLPGFNGLLANEAIKQRIFQAKDLSLQKSGLKRCALFGRRWRAGVFAGSRFTSPPPLFLIIKFIPPTQKTPPSPFPDPRRSGYSRTSLPFNLFESFSRFQLYIFKIGVVLTGSFLLFDAEVKHVLIRIKYFFKHLRSICFQKVILTSKTYAVFVSFLSSIHSSIHPFTHPFIHSFIHSFTRPFIYSYIQPSSFAYFYPCFITDVIKWHLLNYSRPHVSRIESSKHSQIKECDSDFLLNFTKFISNYFFFKTLFNHSLFIRILF